VLCSRVNHTSQWLEPSVYAGLSRRSSGRTVRPLDLVPAPAAGSGDKRRQNPIPPPLSRLSPRRYAAPPAEYGETEQGRRARSRSRTICSGPWRLALIYGSAMGSGDRVRTRGDDVTSRSHLIGPQKVVEPPTGGPVRVTYGRGRTRRMSVSYPCAHKAYPDVGKL
jgi:hypothetical protein